MGGHQQSPLPFCLPPLQDIHFAYAGYAPLSVRLVQQALSRAYVGERRGSGATRLAGDVCRVAATGAGAGVRCWQGRQPESTVRWKLPVQLGSDAGPSPHPTPPHLFPLCSARLGGHREPTAAASRAAAGGGAGQRRAGEAHGAAAGQRACGGRGGRGGGQRAAAQSDGGLHRRRNICRGGCSEWVEGERDRAVLRDDVARLGTQQVARNASTRRSADCCCPTYSLCPPPFPPHPLPGLGAALPEPERHLQLRLPRRHHGHVHRQQPAGGAAAWRRQRRQRRC